MAKKEKKTEEQIKKEQEEKVRNTANTLRVQVLALEKKKKLFFNKVLDAKNKGLVDQEKQARGLLKQTMAAIKRQEGMLMTLELAIEARDLAQLNMNFLESIGSLSDEIISTGKSMSPSKTKAVNKKYLRAVYESNQQKEHIDEMLAVGNYASAINDDGDSYSEFDDEIDSMLESSSSGSIISGSDSSKLIF